jgi:pyruvate dehydrogenase E2 component (dihydrolipoamide acetyltransferase)
MAVEIMLPTLGESIAEATLLRWLKRAGDAVKRGEELAEIETDKATMSLECPADGVLLTVLAEEGSVIVTRQVLAVVGQSGEEWDVVRGSEEDSTLPHAVVSKAAFPPASLRSPLPGERHRISPGARKLAEELGIDVLQVPPSRSGARVVTADVQRYAETLRGEAAVVHLPSHRVSLTRVGKVVAERMLASARLIPQFSVSIEVDAGQLLARREQFRRKVETGGGEVTLTALLAYLVVRALRRHPLLNARFDGDSIVIYDTFNISVAVTTPQGLMVPVLHRLEKMSVTEIARRLTEVTIAAREGRLTPVDAADGTFTLSNLGMFGVNQFVPLVNPPQSAILGVGAARATVVPGVNERVRIAHRMNLTVSADHRVLDGEAVAEFLKTLRETVERCEVDIHDHPLISEDPR